MSCQQWPFGSHVELFCNVLPRFDIFYFFKLFKFKDNKTSRQAGSFLENGARSKYRGLVTRFF